MANLTPEEMADMQASLKGPGPNDREYGHRGKITSNALDVSKTVATASDYAADQEAKQKAPDDGSR